MRIIIIVIYALSISACSAPVLAVRGDSTAIASRDGFARFYNIAPSLDGKRWWNIVKRKSFSGGGAFNDGAKGQNMRTMSEKMQNDFRHRDVATIIYDRRNKGENVDEYIEYLIAAVGTLKTNKFLIMPQIPRSGVHVESSEQVNAMNQIDQRVRMLWPYNTFSAAESEALVGALRSDDTRFDHLHRNSKGQAIEANYIDAWLSTRGWQQRLEN